MSGKSAAVFGLTGGLATALTAELRQREWYVDAFGHHSFPRLPHNAYFFPQGIFDPNPLSVVSLAAISHQIDVGLTNIIGRTSSILCENNPYPRRDFVYIGSTSSYAGFSNSSVYCAVKHGLLGFVRALNEEYKYTDTRFWLFSPGTMNTKMGDKVGGQDASTFLDVNEVAERIVTAISGNIFEPEAILRRRHIR